MFEFTPSLTYGVLLVVQALHLLHHRLAKRHISFVEGTTAVVLCVPPTVPLPGALLMSAHLILVAIQMAGSVWINRLSPSWGSRGEGEKAS